MFACFACMYACTPHAWYPQRTDSIRFPGIGITVMRYHMGAGNWCQGLCKSNKYSYPRSQASKFIFDTLAWSPPVQARLAVQWASEIYLSLSPTLELQGNVSRFLSGCVYLPSLPSVVLKHSLSKTDKYQPRWTWEEGTLVEDLSLSDQPEGKFVVRLIEEGSVHCVPLTLLTV